MALDFGFKATVTITGSFTIVAQDLWLENIVKYAILYGVYVFLFIKILLG